MLLGQRNIPSVIVEYSPAESFFGRRTRTLVLAMQLSDRIEFRLHQRGNSPKRYHDCYAKNLLKLKDCEEAWVKMGLRDMKNEEKGKLSSASETVRMNSKRTTQ